MSNTAPIATTTASTESTPPSTYEIATSVIADAAEDSAEHASSEESAVQTATTANTATANTAAAAPSAAELDEVDRLLQEAGYLPKRPDGYVSRIPYPKARKIIENQLAKERAAQEAKLKEHTDKLTAYEAEIQNFQRLEPVMQNDPEAFIRLLAQVNPGYARFIQNVVAAAETANTVPAIDKDMPKPDLDLGNGQRTYSTEGLQKLLAWQAAHVEERVSKRYQPVEQFIQTARDQQRTTLLEQQAHQAVTSQLQEAASWPMFGPIDPSGKLNEVQEAVLKELQANPKITFHAAYMKVITPRVQADANAKRQDVIKELNAQPRATAAPAGQAAAPVSTGPRSTADIAREVINKLSK